MLKAMLNQNKQTNELVVCDVAHSILTVNPMLYMYQAENDKYYV